MKIAIQMITVLAVAFTVSGQIRNDPKLAVKEGDLHYAVLMEQQELIKGSYEKGGQIIPSFKNWIRIESEPASILFPKLKFYSISWSESSRPGTHIVGLCLLIEKTVGINIDNGKIEEEFYRGDDYKTFGQLLVKNKVVLRDNADAKRIWDAFCDIHRYWKEQPIKKISDTEWHMGIRSYDEEIGGTATSNTAVTRTDYMRVLVDKDSKQVLSWKSMMDTSSERKVDKPDRQPKP